MIDEILSSEPDPALVMKMDIENLECRAILGKSNIYALPILSAYKCKVALLCHHCTS